MKIKKSLRDFLIPFIIGYLLKEVIEFVRERGLESDHQLTKCLFFIIVCVAALLWMWTNCEIEDVRSDLSKVAQTTETIKGKISNSTLIVRDSTRDPRPIS